MMQTEGMLHRALLCCFMCREPTCYMPSCPAERLAPILCNTAQTGSAEEGGGSRDTGRERERERESGKRERWMNNMRLLFQAQMQ